MQKKLLADKYSMHNKVHFLVGHIKISPELAGKPIFVVNSFDTRSRGPLSQHILDVRCCYISHVGITSIFLGKKCLLSEISTSCLSKSALLMSVPRCDRHLLTFGTDEASLLAGINLNVRPSTKRGKWYLSTNWQRLLVAVMDQKLLCQQPILDNLLS